MARSRRVRIVVALVVASVGLSGLLLTVPNVQAATWTQDTDGDFSAGTLSNVVIAGTGPAAVIQLAQDATDWKNETPTGAPGAREGPALAYDSANNVVVMFGGYSGTANLDDTWEHTPATNTWTQISVAGPSARAYAGMTFDATNGVVVLFGGFSDAGPEADTWEYDAAADAWSETTPATSPSGMFSYHLTFVSTRDRVLLEGLSDLSNTMETWDYDAATDTWTDRLVTSHPTDRWSFGMTYHGGLDRVVLFGGSDFAGAVGDTWEYDWTANAWTQTVPGGGGPTARWSMGLTYRGSTGEVWLFGGTAGTPQSDTWRYFDGGGFRVWVPTPTQRNPSARHTFGITDESPGRESFLYGGVAADGRQSDTWSLGPVYRGSGTFMSQRFDSQGANVNWNTLFWEPPAGQPPGTILRFQTAASNDPAGPWTFLGPACTGTGYYTTSGTTICSQHDGKRYLHVRAYLLTTTDNLVTPTMDSFTVDYTVPAANPFILFTDPTNGELGVLETDPIFIRFSEAMDTTSVQYTIDPPVTVTESWSEGDSALTLSHAAPLAERTLYRVTVTAAKDQAGNDLVAGPVPNPWVFTTRGINPTITATVPTQGQNDVPFAASIVVDFSEPMDTTSVTWSITPSITLTPTWSGGDTRLTLSHATDFPQCEVHSVEITGMDLAGLPLVPGPAPNPWSFTTLCTIPFIVTTNPAHLQTGVAGTADIVVQFSEPMQPATVTWSIAPATTLTPAWSNGDRTLTLSHVSPWAACTMVAMQITGGKDLDGNDLFTNPGYAPNPWKFAVVCANPFLVATSPADGEMDVDRFANIIIVFSEGMNPASVTWTIDPPLLVIPNWISTNDLLTLTHFDPFPCGLTTVTITGEDGSGNGLVPGLAPNPWSFTPVCPNPYIVSTNPADGATGVALNADIVVTFSETMDTTSVTWAIDPTIALAPAWSLGDTVLTLAHATPFAETTTYTVTILSGMDLDGNNLIAGPAPNPWSFTTVGTDPYIVSTDPADGATDVPLDRDVVIVFSEPMNIATVTAVSSPVVAFMPAWTNGNGTLTLSHAPFAECTQYTITVSGQDEQGNLLVPGPVPNPFSFNTVCVAPYIVDTNPADGATNVPLGAEIWVNFSEPMNIATVNVILAPPLVLQPFWSNGDRTLRLTHATPFTDCVLYTVAVTGQDPDLNDLVAGPVPNPWSFRAACVAPYIVSTDPADGATDVATGAPIIVTFSEPIDHTGQPFTWTVSPAITLVPAWAGGNDIVTFTHVAPFAECTTYTVGITEARDADGNGLVPGPVPNPWSFDTTCTVAAPGGLQIARVPPSIRLTWTAVPGADLYRVYESQDRLAAWPWAVLGTTATTTFDALAHEADGLPHFYVARAVRGTTEGGNSTMAAKALINVMFNPGTSNIRWFSLPYRSPYARASDIANELTNARIDVIAKWNPATQSPILYYWFRGAWRGTDFSIAAGDGLYVGYKQSFSWVVVGTDRAATLSFTANPPPNANVNWISLPYTSPYARASDLVLDIEGNTGPGANTKIVEVAKWDAATQTLVRYYWTAGGWTGTDFALTPGDGLYFRIVSTFTWQPRLLIPEVP